MMSEAIADQSALSNKRKESEKRDEQRRKMAIDGLIGLVVGLTVGHFGFDSLMPSGLFGAVSGMLSLRWLDSK